MAGIASKFLYLLRQQGGGAPPAATWDSVITALSPTHRFQLTEASGDFANTGSAGGTAPFAGTPTYQAGSLINPAAGIGVENDDGWNFTKPETLSVVTTLMLIRTPTTLGQVNYVADPSQNFIMRVLTDGTLRFIDELNGVTMSSASGVMKANQWNLVAFQPNPAGGSKIFHTSQDTGGTVSEVASGGAPAVGFIGGVFVRGSAGVETAIIGELAVIDGATTLSDLQALADTLTWT